MREETKSDRNTLRHRQVVLFRAIESRLHNKKIGQVAYIKLQNPVGPDDLVGSRPKQSISIALALECTHRYSTRHPATRTTCVEDAVWLIFHFC